MHRWLVVAALGAAFLTLPVWGQRRGGGGGFGGHAGFSGGHSMGGGRGSMMSPRDFGGFPRGGGVHFGNGFGRPGFGYRRGRFFRSWPYTWSNGYPYYGYPWGAYGDDSYSADYESYPPSDYSGAYVENDRQQAAIDRLENEVDRLRQEREARESQSSQARSKSDSQPTELVFRDQHTEEIQNYAIVGQTLWVLSAQRARKIPLAELDIPATKKANDDRGVDFQLPG
jgi:hypothetical protein